MAAVLRDLVTDRPPGAGGGLAGQNQRARLAAGYFPPWVRCGVYCGPYVPRGVPNADSSPLSWLLLQGFDVVPGVPLRAQAHLADFGAVRKWGNAVPARGGQEHPDLDGAGPQGAATVPGLAGCRLVPSPWRACGGLAQRMVACA